MLAPIAFTTLLQVFLFILGVTPDKECTWPVVLTKKSFDQFPYNCTYVTGNFELSYINLTEEVLASKLSSIVTIDGWINIYRTSYTSLSFFSSLTTVKAGPVREMYTHDTIYIGENKKLKTLGIPLLVNVEVSNAYSFYIEKNPKLCLSKTELNNFISLEAINLDSPLCGNDTSFCFGDITQISPDCRIYYGNIQTAQLKVFNQSHLDKLSNLQIINSIIAITGTKFKNITLNVEFIYDSGWVKNSIHIEDNPKLEIFAMPNLKKIVYPNTLGMKIVNNKLLKLTDSFCKTYGSMLKVTTKGNSQDCADADLKWSLCSNKLMIGNVVILVVRSIYLLNKD